MNRFLGQYYYFCKQNCLKQKGLQTRLLARSIFQSRNYQYSFHQKDLHGKKSLHIIRYHTSAKISFKIRIVNVEIRRIPYCCSFEFIIIEIGVNNFWIEDPSTLAPSNLLSLKLEFLLDRPLFHAKRIDAEPTHAPTSAAAQCVPRDAAEQQHRTQRTRRGDGTQPAGLSLAAAAGGLIVHEHAKRLCVCECGKSATRSHAPQPTSVSNSSLRRAAVSRQYSLYGVGATHDVRRSADVAVLRRL